MKSKRKNKKGQRGTKKNKSRNKQENHVKGKALNTGKLSVEHITYLGSHLSRDISRIDDSIIYHFKDFQISTGEVIIRIKDSTFECKAKVEDGFGVFELISNDRVVTRNLCCFGINEDKAKSILNSEIERYPNHRFTELYRSFNQGKVPYFPKKGFWLYTFMTNLVWPAEAMEAGEIELYIYDALRRGVNMNSSTSEPTQDNIDIKGVIIKWAETFGRNWNSFIHLGKSYPFSIPEDLNSWHVYVLDAGHCVLCLLESDMKEIPDSNHEDYLIPIPVKTVLRKYGIQEQFIVVDLPYNEKTGVENIPMEDYEY